MNQAVNNNGSTPLRAPAFAGLVKEAQTSSRALVLRLTLETNSKPRVVNNSAMTRATISAWRVQSGIARVVVVTGRLA